MTINCYSDLANGGTDSTEKSKMRESGEQIFIIIKRRFLRYMAIYEFAIHFYNLRFYIIRPFMSRNKIKKFHTEENRNIRSYYIK